MDDGEVDRKIRRRCTCCGEEWEEKANSHGTGYDCVSCGAPARNFERVDDDA